MKITIITKTEKEVKRIQTISCYLPDIKQKKKRDTTKPLVFTFRSPENVVVWIFFFTFQLFVSFHSYKISRAASSIR